MNPRPLRLLFYSHNGVGLGHFRRQLRLARAFRRRRPDSIVVLATGSQATRAFGSPPGVEVVQLPPIRKIGRYEAWAPHQQAASIEDVGRVRTRILLDLVRQLRPDLLVADHMPAGPQDELVAALEELQAIGGRAVAGFRDVVDEPEFVRQLWSRTDVYDVLREHYDAICVYGTPEVMDFELDYGLGGVLAERLRYVGYLGVAGAVEISPSTSPPTFVASSGGGVDGGGLLHSFIKAAKLLGPRLGGSRVVVSGPLLPEGELMSLQKEAAGTGIEIRRFESELDDWIARSDLVVMMPGYNSTCELLCGRARAIVVPRAGPSHEQRIRAEALSRWGRAVTLEPLELHARQLAEAIEVALAGPVCSPTPVPLDGIARAVDLFEAIAVGEPARVGPA
jgi:predicted glycosyltransferase